MTVPQEMLDIVKQALNAEYVALLPEGFQIYKVDEYDPAKHTAPNLWYEKLKVVPDAKYLAVLVGPTSSVPALGETVNDAIKRAIAKIESRAAAAN